MYVSWRASAPWTIAITATLAGAVMLVVGTPPDTPASFGWFAYQPLAIETYGLLGGVSLSLTSIIGFVMATLGLLCLSFLIGRRARQRRSAAQPPPRRRMRVAWWGIAALIIVGGVIAYIGLSTPQPYFMYGDSYIAFADSQPRLSTHDLLRDRFVVTPTAFFGTAVTVGGLVVAAFLLGRFGISRRTTLAPETAEHVDPEAQETDG